jgi:hypothetical protein
MKLESLFSLRLCRLSVFTVVAVSLLLTTACNSDKTEVADAILAGALVYPCNTADSVDFPLETQVPESGDMDFVTDVETGPYQLSDCLCEIEEFGFIFQDVDPDWAIIVLDSQGDTLKIELTINQNGTAYILFPNPEDLPDEHLTMFFDFDSGGDGPSPTLVHAGGLCIIENVVGTGDWQTFVLPYKLTHVPAPGDTSTRVFIPSRIGGVPY